MAQSSDRSSHQRGARSKHDPYERLARRNSICRPHVRFGNVRYRGCFDCRRNSSRHIPQELRVRDMARFRPRVTRGNIQRRLRRTRGNRAHRCRRHTAPSHRNIDGERQKRRRGPLHHFREKPIEDWTQAPSPAGVLITNPPTASAYRPTT